MKYKEFIDCYRNKEEKPKHTNRFIKNFQQTNSGKRTYLNEAILQGKMIYKKEGEPNQKWHLINSWYENKVKENRNFENQEVCAWCRLSCPELMLWIAEVSGQQEKVKSLVDMFERTLIIDGNVKNDRESRSEMVKEIKKKIKWQEIIDYINKQYDT